MYFLSLSLVPVCLSRCPPNSVHYQPFLNLGVPISENNSVQPAVGLKAFCSSDPVFPGRRWDWASSLLHLLAPVSLLARPPVCLRGCFAFFQESCCMLASQPLVLVRWGDASLLLNGERRDAPPHLAPALPPPSSPARLYKANRPLYSAGPGCPRPPYKARRLFCDSGAGAGGRGRRCHQSPAEHPPPVLPQL